MNNEKLKRFQQLNVKMTFPDHITRLHCPTGFLQVNLHFVVVFAEKSKAIINIQRKVIRLFPVEQKLSEINLKVGKLWFLFLFLSKPVDYPSNNPE
jgi:hypothetical protein